ncbi:hypothetical protein [Aromatoleum evansii]|uniref:hypothetical protein n=1 Tax=Aromatoleum evansii TaxID=59406 RepID=UPI00145D1310|nr:hypothetical protein [Aromatoleum evansii]NMG30017.1 hypothetical protein [Aromatoleum evansii]
MRKNVLGLCAAIFSGLLLAQPAWAAKSVNIDATPAQSTGGVTVDVNGATATYQYTIYDGQSVSDTIPVEICMTGYETGWTSLAVTFGTQGGPLSGVTPPANQTFSATTPPDCRSLTIGIATGALTLANPSISQNFNANFSLSDTAPNPATGANKPQASFTDVRNIHVQVTVLPALSNVSCFLTDSEGNFLTDCAGVPVTASGSDDGRFAIVANKKLIEVATNPGQFYYNLVWHNATGISQAVNVGFDREGTVVPKGRQAIHAAVFNGYLNPLTPTEFEEANVNGIAEGADDAVSGIEVPAGASLLVTYHLEWSGLGSSVPVNCAANCAGANQRAAVTGQVSGDGIVTEQCKAEAYGYKKN